MNKDEYNVSMNFWDQIKHSKCSQRLHVFDQKYSKNNNIVKLYYYYYHLDFFFKN